MRWTHLEDYEHCATTEHPEEGHQVKEYDLKRKPHDYVIHALHIKHIIIIKHMFYPQKNTWWHEYYPCITNNFPKGKLNWRILKKRKVCCEDSSDSTNTKFWNKCFHMFCKTNLWSECPTLMSEIGVCNMSWFQTKVNLMTAGPKFTYLFPSALSFDIQNCIWYFSYRKVDSLVNTRYWGQLLRVLFASLLARFGTTKDGGSRRRPVEWDSAEQAVSGSPPM